MTSKRTTLLIWFAAITAGTLLISNLCAVKLWNLFGIPVDGGIVLFPISYIIGDLSVELFRDKARTIIYAAFFVNVMAAIAFYAAIALPPYPGWEMQEAFAMVLGFSPRIILGSLCGFLASGLLNNWLFEKMRQSSGWLSKSFIGRALTSSVAAHVADTLIFETIAFLGVLSFPEFVTQAVFAYLLGMGLELILSPLEIVLEKRLKKYE